MIMNIDAADHLKKKITHKLDLKFIQVVKGVGNDETRMKNVRGINCYIRVDYILLSFHRFKNVQFSNV